MTSTHVYRITIGSRCSVIPANAVRQSIAAISCGLSSYFSHPCLYLEYAIALPEGLGRAIGDTLPNESDRAADLVLQLVSDSDQPAA